MLISPIIFYGVPFDILLHIILNKTHWNCFHHTLDLQRTLDVKEVTSFLANYICEPDNFPGIIYKHNSRISCLIFASGKVVVAGVKSEDQLENVADEIAKIL